MSMCPELPRTPEETGRSVRKMMDAVGAIFCDVWLDTEGMKIVVAEMPTNAMLANLKELHRIAIGENAVITVGEDRGSHYFLITS